MVHADWTIVPARGLQVSYYLFIYFSKAKREKRKEKKSRGYNATQ